MSNNRNGLTRRDRPERAPANKAASALRRVADQDMAENYVAVLRDFALRDPVISLRKCGAV